MKPNILRGIPEWLIPDLDKKAQSIFGQERKFSRSRSSTPKVSTVTGDDGQVTQQPHSMLTEEDPLTGLTRLSISKFKRDKRMFESWYVSFYQIAGKYKKVPPEQKLLRLYSCLEGEALLTIQNLGYSIYAVYDVAIARLIGKYGGKRRELTMRLELDKFYGVRMGNANDLERFTELLDTLVVKLCDPGQDGELGACSLYVSLLRKLNEQLIVKYQDWLREKHLEGNMRNLHAFINDEAESWMVALETVRGLGQQKTKVLSAGSTLAITQVSVKKKSVPVKCKICSKERGLWLCEQFKALPVDQLWEKARELRVCFSCLSHSLRSSTCRRARRCPIVGCCSNHHRLLHNEVNQRMPMAVSPNPNVAEVLQGDSQEANGSSSLSRNGTEGEPELRRFVTSLSETKEYLPLRTIPVIVKSGHKSLRINALLDDGSTRSYINEDVADCLGLEGEPVLLNGRLLNDTTASLKSRSVQFDLESSDCGVKKAVSAQTTKRVTGNMHAINSVAEKNRWPHLSAIHFQPLGRSPIIDMLIGLTYLTYTVL